MIPDEYFFGNNCRCNHPDNDATLMKAARREEQEEYYHQSETGAANEIPLK